MTLEDLNRDVMTVLLQSPPKVAHTAIMRLFCDFNNRLVQAVRDVYYAGHWTCDRPVDAMRLWTELRDAAGFTPGQSPGPVSTSTKWTACSKYVAKNIDPSYGSELAGDATFCATCNQPWEDHQPSAKKAYLRGFRDCATAIKNLVDRVVEERNAK